MYYYYFISVAIYLTHQLTPPLNPTPTFSFLFSEICDFIAPIGGRLRKVHELEWDTKLQEMQYGHRQSRRSGRCFVFVLDDRTMSVDEANEELGTGTGRLYGVCVMHPRVLSATEGTVGLEDNDTASGSASGSGSATATATASAGDSFESAVVYAFVTRFPLFDFFFQVGAEQFSPLDSLYIYTLVFLFLFLTTHHHTLPSPPPSPPPPRSTPLLVSWSP